MPQDKDDSSIDWTNLFSATSIVLVGDPLSGIFNVEEHIKLINPKSEIVVVHDRTAITLFEKADLILEIVQNLRGTQVERVLIIQKWKGHEVPGNLVPFLIKPNKIEPDTKARVV